jgi:hypothetical protein
MLAFGMFGVVLVAVLFAVGVRWLDLAPTPARTAWTGLQPRMAALAFTPVLLIFLSRGPLVPAIAYSTGNWFAAGAAALLITRLLMAPTSAPTGGPSSPPAPSAKRLGDRWAQRGPIVMATETLRGARERRRSNDLHGSRHATTGIRSGTPSVSTARGALRNLPPRTGQVYE